MPRRGVTTPEVRTGQAPAPLSRSEFRVRFMRRFADPAYATEAESLARIEAIAWEAQHEGRKTPVTQRAGHRFADPDCELSVEWLATHQRLQAAQKHWAAPAGKGRVLIINGSARNDGTCPGELSKSWRMVQMARRTVTAAGLQADVLDLSLVTSEYGRSIHPCKGCVSTAMPLCHWPCSCYPNHAMGHTDDWMAEIYERWVLAHGVLIVTPTYWYQSPAPLKSMIDRMVCADGGNPDPTTTHGKKAAEAKALEQKGWDFPKHLEGRVYGVVVHGDVAGVEAQRHNITDWLDWMGLRRAGEKAVLDRYLGYYEPYWNSHDALDQDTALQEEVRNAARAVAAAVLLLRKGQWQAPDRRLRAPRPK